ncbi:protein phosphatase 2C domain-containing protein [Streptomyces albiaxialis]|uniref:Protein phosphatase 2C domain-containing protein n=1 Tax=Streptomyces albiaxialis TaxID=329523 RepID=A0ABN2WCT1_9ACTN
MPQLDQLSVCPSCAEPLEEGDRFCGACGADLAAARRAAEAGAGAPGEDRPTLPVNGVPARESLPVTPPPGRHAEAGRADAARGEAGLGAAGEARRPSADAGRRPSADADFTLQPARPTEPTEERPGASREATPSPSAAPAPDPRAADPRALREDGPRGHDGHDDRDGGDDRDGTVFLDVGGGEPARRAGSEPLGDVPSGMSGPELLGPRCVACGTGTIDDDGYCEHCGHKQPRERDHMERALDTVAAASDRGLRHHRNEDYFAVTETTGPSGVPATIAVVCDGVSSATRPDEASAAAAVAASASLSDAVVRGTHPQQAMHDALVAASEAVNVLAEDTPPEPSKNAPACTIVGALTADGILTVGWVGDSRAYWVPQDRSAPAARLTEDDSWAAQMVAAGLMNEAEAYADSRAHAITGWLGADAYELDPHTASFKPDRAGVVVVCTDGLWNYAESADEMAAAVPHDALNRPLHSAQHLVGYALDGGGHDNVTVAVVPFPAPSGRAGSA